MKNSLLFDFVVDKSTNTVVITREFAAEIALVWDAFTVQNILDQWWAPKPWTSFTKHMDFRSGGRRLYAMRGPNGEEHWAIQDFTSITPKSNFKFIDAFSDENENVNAQMPSSEWNVDFEEDDGITTVTITIKHKSLADLEQIIDMGFKEGFTMTLDYLETLLSE